MSWVDRWLARLGGVPAGREPARGDPVRVREVEAVLDELRPMLRADAGEVDLVAVADDLWVEVRMRGACASCHAQDTTLEGALEPLLKQRLGWIAGVRGV